MDDDDIFYDSDFDALAVQSQTPQDQEANNSADDFDDEFGDDFGDDLDLTELDRVTETAEQQQLVTKSNNSISFVPLDDTDVEPPPALPESTPSFHPLHHENLRTWIYPINYPIRGYQLNIVKKAMFHNTLVALPTGLGKTFIAAVVMYNYWRWFPTSKIIFMAPTRPLVTQQIEACFTICGLPQEDTTDISGSISPEKRVGLWQKKRVFFATPQVVFNDLVSNTCPGDRVACIVVDEAHRATGNYSYVQVIRKIAKKNNQFRVLALTATPGSNLDTVQNVITNLQISNIQIRTEESMDIQQFSHGKNIQSIIVPLGYTHGSVGILPSIIQEFKTKVYEPMLKELSRHPTGVYPEADRNSSYGLQICRQRFTAGSNNINSGFKFSIIKKFLRTEKLGRAYELLCQHGVASFVECLESNMEEDEGKKSQPISNDAYTERLITRLKQEMQKPDFIGHPKLEKLLSILLSHFSDLPSGSSSKVMIFSSYRSSVNEICKVLNRQTPILRCSSFVGQAEGKNGSKGLKQSEQQEVIQKFKSNEFNVIVSTSIGEEGLDIGEVDLIICYDSQSSPIRMLQRMGRTGRKRQGKCVLLMTEAEEKKFNQAKSTYANVQRLISQGVHLNYFSPNPTVIPANYKPTLSRQTLNVGQFQPKQSKSKRASKNTIKNITANNPDMTLDGLMKPHVEESFIRSFGLPQNAKLSQVFEEFWPQRSIKTTFRQHIPLQTKLRPTYRIGHSKRTHDFVHLVKKIEHRILNPDEEITFKLPKQQTRLIMPSKSGNANKLIMNKRKKKQYDEFGDPVENNSLAQFLNPGASELANNFSDGIFNGFEDELAPKETHDFFLPRKKQKTNFTKPTKDKGKGKCIEKSTSRSSDDIIHEMNIPDIGPSKKNPDKGKTKAKELSFSLNNIATETEIPNVEMDTKSLDKGKGKEPSFLENEIPDIGTSIHDKNINQTEDSDEFEDAKSWSSLLPDSVFEHVSPLKDTHAIKPCSPPIIEKESSDTIVVSSQPMDEVTEYNIADLYNQASDDDFEDDDFPLDELCIREMETLRDLKSKGFDDRLDPIFPFEKEEHTLMDTFSFVWSDTIPKFSSKALALLESRQQDLKKRFGKFLSMNLFSKYNNKASPVIKSSSCEQDVVMSQHDAVEDEFGMLDDSIFEQIDTLENQMQEKPISICSESPEIEQLEEQSKISVSSKTEHEISGSSEDSQKEGSDINVPSKAENQITEPSEDDDKEGGGFSDIDFEGNELISFFQDNVENHIEEDAGFTNINFEGNEFSSIFRNNPTEEINDSDDEVIIYQPSPKKLNKTHEVSDIYKNDTIEKNDNDDSDEDEDDEVIIYKPSARKLKRRLELAEENHNNKKPKLIESEESDNVDPSVIEENDEEDDDIIIYKRPLAQNIKRKLKTSKEKENVLEENPFFDVEAEKSSDDGHTSEDELESGSSAMRSFIDYEENSRSELNAHAIYRDGPDDMPNNSRHWLNRFNAEKWLNPQEDSIVEEEGEGEEGESIVEVSSNIFTSDLFENQNNDEDDFM